MALVGGVLAVTLAAPLTESLADPPSIEARIEALGAAREGEDEIYGQLARALSAAEAAAAEGDTARAERHRDLAEALVRSLVARRRITEARRRLAEREAALAAARARLATARGAQESAQRETARLGAAEEASTAEVAR
ncbi:MAG: hypothetical protein OHK0013_29310 [Sandaracinaceae bacterium]